MGRNTPSLRIVVREYAERLRKTAEVLPPSERVLVEEFLKDIETTLSACIHVGVTDPIEVFILHLIRKLRDFCSHCK